MHELVHLNRASHLQRVCIRAEAYINQGHSEDKSTSHHVNDIGQSESLRDVNQSLHVTSVHLLF